MTEFYIIEEKKKELLKSIIETWLGGSVLVLLFLMLFTLEFRVFIEHGFKDSLMILGKLLGVSSLPLIVPFTTYFSYVLANRNRKYTFNYKTNSLDIEKEGEVRSVKFTEFKKAFVYGGPKKIYNRDTEEVWREFYHFKIVLKNGEKIFITSLTDIPVSFKSIPIKIKRRMRMVRIAI